MASSQQILSLYKSRVTIIQLLKTLGYNVEDNDNFSINEVDAMSRNSQLDMLIEHSTETKKAYIKFVPCVRQGNLDNIVDDLFLSEAILDKHTDVLILVSDDEPNDMIRSKVNYLYNHDGIFVVIHNIKRLQFNILEHKDVPAVRILTDEEKSQLMEKYRINDSQLPTISRFDPVALAICLRPGQVCVFKRNSVVAMETDFYRICE